MLTDAERQTLYNRLIRELGGDPVAAISAYLGPGVAAHIPRQPSGSAYAWAVIRFCEDAGWEGDRPLLFQLLEKFTIFPDMAQLLADLKGRRPRIEEAPVTPTRPAATAPPRTGPLRLFYCNAPQDEKARKALEGHLTPLQTQGLIRGFSESRILAGHNLQLVIDREIAEADVFVLLISADFLSSAQCMDIADRALRRGAHIIPVQVRAVMWDVTPFAKLQPLPRNGRPVRNWDDQDTAWLAVAKEVREVLLQLASGAQADTAGTVQTGAAQTGASTGAAQPGAALAGSAHAPSGPPSSTQSSDTVDLAILIALREEFRELFNEIRASHTAVTLNGHTYYFFTRRGPDPDRPYRCVTTFIGDMNPTPAALAAERLIGQYHPSLMALLGIAAGINADVRVGDVVVATQVDGYLESAKALSSPGLGEARQAFEFKLSGEVYRTSPDIVSLLRNFEFAHFQLHEHWRADGQQELEKLMPDAAKRRELCDQRLIEEACKLLDGHLASGPVVGASKAYIRWLQERDRKLLALEMESVGLMAAVQGHLGTTQTLVLRGISDLGDERKAELDRTTGGSLRRLAMGNSIRLLFALMEAGVLPQGGP